VNCIKRSGVIGVTEAVAMSGMEVRAGRGITANSLAIADRRALRFLLSNRLHYRTGDRLTAGRGVPGCRGLPSGAPELPVVSST
jgi:hypothetical protein